MKTVIVIGGGASGIMAAITAASNGCDVTVLEAGEKPLKKLLVTGNGRCNFTNFNWTDKTVIRGSNAEKALDIINGFNCDDVISFFENIGLQSKQREGWVYPINDSASAVARLLLYRAQELKIKIKTNQRVQSVEKDEYGAFIVCTQDWEYKCDRVVVSTGSPAQAEASNCGLLLDIAKYFGINYTAFSPAITSLKSNKKGLAKWSGVRTDGEIILMKESEEIARAKGQLQLTEYGISGIPIFEISRYAVQLLEKGDKIDLKIDFMSDIEISKLRKQIYGIKEMYPNRSTKAILLGFLNERLADFIASQSSTLEECISAIKCFCIPITGYMGFDKAQACMGGVDLNALTETLEAKKCTGLYFTGEAVDIDGKCGGYNLQWAWSSGYAAGKACSR